MEALVRIANVYKEQTLSKNLELIADIEKLTTIPTAHGWIITPHNYSPNKLLGILYSIGDVTTIVKPYLCIANLDAVFSGEQLYNLGEFIFLFEKLGGEYYHSLQALHDKLSTLGDTNGESK